jgi:uncharacterized coiled-coil protein SlyX
MRIKELEEVHASDSAELERSTAELKILSEQLAGSKEDVAAAAAARGEQMRQLNDRLAAAQSEQVEAQSRLEEAVARCEQLEHERKDWEAEDRAHYVSCRVRDGVPEAVAEAEYEQRKRSR